MNEFIITEVEFSSQNNYFQDYIETPQRIILKLETLNITSELIRKINNIIKTQRTVTINDTKYNKHIEPFKKEFIEFLKEKYPDKILKNIDEWNFIENM